MAWNIANADAAHAMNECFVAQKYACDDKADQISLAVTASPFAVVAKPPRKKKNEKDELYFRFAHPLGVAPSRSMIDLVHIGINQSTTHMMTMKTSSTNVEALRKSPPSASTVPRNQ